MRDYYWLYLADDYLLDNRNGISTGRFHFRNSALKEFMNCLGYCIYSKEIYTVKPIDVKRTLSKRPKISFQDRLSLNAGQKYCRMLPLEHSAILSTFIKLPVVFKTFVLSIFEWPFYTGFTVIVIA